jgi:hypothetical protein
MQSIRSSVMAVAGRRIDAPSTNAPRFPRANVAKVRRHMAGLFDSEHALAVVSSAACGTDLIALEQAERLKIRWRVILPFAAEKFRNTSVTDRGGEWGPLFDRLIATAAARGDLVVLGYDSSERDSDSAYAATNKIIIEEAKDLAAALPHGPHRLVAVIAWDGAASVGTDITDEFRRLARAAHFDEERIVKTN